MTWHGSSNLKYIYEVGNFIKWGFQTESQSELNCLFYRSAKYQNEPKLQKVTFDN